MKRAGAGLAIVLLVMAVSAETRGADPGRTAPADPERHAHDRPLLIVTLLIGGFR